MVEDIIGKTNQMFGNKREFQREESGIVSLLGGPGEGLHLVLDSDEANIKDIHDQTSYIKDLIDKFDIWYKNYMTEERGNSAGKNAREISNGYFCGEYYFDRDNCFRFYVENEKEEVFPKRNNPSPEKSQSLKILYYAYYNVSERAAEEISFYITQNLTSPDNGKISGYRIEKQ